VTSFHLVDGSRVPDSGFYDEGKKLIG